MKILLMFCRTCFAVFSRWRGALGRETQPRVLLRENEDNPLDARQAERALDWLDARGEANRQTTQDGILEPPITGAMMVEMPPRPVMDASECPPGSSLAGGLCRTPEGYLRPLPDWLVEFLEQDR